MRLLLSTLYGFQGISSLILKSIFYFQSHIILTQCFYPIITDLTIVKKLPRKNALIAEKRRVFHSDPAIIV